MSHGRITYVPVSLLDRAIYSYADVDRLVGMRPGTARRWLEGYQCGGHGSSSQTPALLQSDCKDTSDDPSLAGIHHLKLPVSDLARSRAWYESRLGYVLAVEFVEGGTLTGIAMRHPDGGPELAFRLNPSRALASAGFDYFTIGVPDKEAIERLADHLTELGERHAGVHFASIGWILPELHDPDGHEVRFYTISAHRELAEGEVIVVSDTRETTEAAERELANG